MLVFRDYEKSLGKLVNPLIFDIVDNRKSSRWIRKKGSSKNRGI